MLYGFDKVWLFCYKRSVVTFQHPPIKWWQFFYFGEQNAVIKIKLNIQPLQIKWFKKHLG